MKTASKAKAAEAAKGKSDSATKAPPATVAPSDPGRDTSTIDTAGWNFRPLKNPQGPRTNSFQVVYRQSALDQIHMHGQGTTDVEVCGALIGRGFVDDAGPYLLVEHSIRGANAASRSTNVTFTAETWNSIQTVMDRDYAGKLMVGWYHTHPGFGIFLSDMDVFICDNFFNLPWQSAFVYDPIGGDEGNFLWRTGRPTREPILIEDDVTPVAAGVPLIGITEAMTGNPPPDAPAGPSRDDVRELMIRVRRLEKRLKALAIGTVFLAAFVIMWIISVATDSNVWMPRQNTAPATRPAQPARPADHLQPAKSPR
jgi:proteasome lid subunit RPN8/RPN11